MNEQTKPVNWIAIVAIGIMAIVGALGYAIFFVPGAGEQLKTIYTQSILLGLAAVTGYYFNSSADQAKKAEEAAKRPMPQVEVPEQTLDAIPPERQ
jgi:hypothetical protein